VHGRRTTLHALNPGIRNHPAFWPAILFVAALGVFWLQAIAWPVSAGRDVPSYLIYYNHFWDANPPSFTNMVFRTPLTPLVLGGLLRLGGHNLVEIAASLMFAASIAATCIFAQAWSRTVAVAAAAALMLYPTYGAIFHFFSSDGLLAFGFTSWLAFLAHTGPGARRRVYAWHGLCLFALVMIRPTMQVFLLLALQPWLLDGLTMRERSVRAGLMLATAAVLLGLWSTHNWLRYEDFTVARGGNAHVPFWRVFVSDRIVARDNGPASRALAQAVERDLLDREPYRTLGITADEALASGDPRVWSDLVVLVDRQWGWDNDHRELRAVALEAIRAHPVRYVRGVIGTLYWALVSDLSKPARVPGSTAPRPRKLATFHKADALIIPYSNQHWLGSRPPDRPPAERAAGPDADDGNGWELANQRAFMRPVRAGSAAAAHVLNFWVQKFYPPMLVLIGVGLLGVVLTRHPARRLMLFATGVTLLHFVIVYASENLTLEYRIPFDPVFFVIGAAGFIRYGFGAVVHRTDGEAAPADRTG